MTDQKHPNPDRYALVIEGVRWEYDGKTNAEWPWVDAPLDTGRVTTDSMIASFPTHAPAILDIVKRWHEDRMPRVRRRVVLCDDTKFTVAYAGGICHASSDKTDDEVREWAKEEQDVSAAQVRVMADLIANPDEPEPTDGN